MSCRCDLKFVKKRTEMEGVQRRQLSLKLKALKGSKIERFGVGTGSFDRQDNACPSLRCQINEHRISYILKR